MSVHYHSGAFPPLDLNWQKLIKPIADASDSKYTVIMRL